MLHPADTALWNRAEKLAWDLNKQFELGLRAIEPKARPGGNSWGLCYTTQRRISILIRDRNLMRDGGEWAPQPRSWEDIRKTVCHELAHLTHADHGEQFALLHAQILAAALELEKLTFREQIISRIRKLQAKADSAHEIGQVAEAQAFATKVQELLAQHKLDMAEIEQQSYIREEIDTEKFEGSPTGKPSRKRTYWTQRLAAEIAGAYGCSILVMEGSSTMLMVGRQSDRAVAIYMFDRLRTAIHNEATIRYDKIYTPGMPGGWRESFRRGAIDSLATRFEMQRLAQEQKSESASFALMIRDPAKEVKEWVSQRYQTGSSIGGCSTHNQRARQEGNRFGEQLQLHAGIE